MGAMYVQVVPESLNARQSDSSISNTSKLHYPSDEEVHITTLEQ